MLWVPYFFTVVSLDKYCDSWGHVICKIQWQKRAGSAQHYRTCTTLNMTSNRNYKKAKGVGCGVRITLHAQTCSKRNSAIWSDGQIQTTMNKPATLPRRQPLIRYLFTNPVNRIRCCRSVTRRMLLRWPCNLQVSTHRGRKRTTTIPKSGSTWRVAATLQLGYEPEASKFLIIAVTLGSRDANQLEV